MPKFFVLEWYPNREESNQLEVTEHNDGGEALNQAKNSQAPFHCVSTVNPLTGEGSEDNPNTGKD